MRDMAATAGDMMAQMAAILRAAGVDQPRRTAARLWRDLEVDIDAATAPAAGVADRDAERLVAAARRVATGEPVQYATGVAGFRHLTLNSDPRALIPRPETEGLVEAVLARVRTGRAADICTGSGAIALALADEGDFDEVIGIDLSPGAIELARTNGRRTALDVTWLEGDLVAPLTGAVDLLVSNPPYIAMEEYEALDASVRDHEPRMALVSGADGLDVTRRLLAAGRSVVRAGGWIAIEVDCRRAAQSAQLAGASGWSDVMVQDDLFG
ncbi:MAG: peptide chain release factor N(5)-glutamine methyltransferase, partial [Gemmatimonadales bacterium]